MNSPVLARTYERTRQPLKQAQRKRPAVRGGPGRGQRGWHGFWDGLLAEKNTQVNLRYRLKDTMHCTNEYLTSVALRRQDHAATKGLTNAASEGQGPVPTFSLTARVAVSKIKVTGSIGTMVPRSDSTSPEIDSVPKE